MCVCEREREREREGGRERERERGERESHVPPQKHRQPYIKKEDFLHNSKLLTLLPQVISDVIDQCRLLLGRDSEVCELATMGTHREAH